MEDYTKFEVGGLQVWTKTIHQMVRKVKLDLNVTLVFSRIDKCSLAQSAQSIVLGSMYELRSTGITRALEDAVEKAFRNFLLKADVADQADEKLIKVAEQLMQVYSSFPQEKISSLLLPVILTDEINFKDRLGHESKVNAAIFVPARKISIVIVKKEFLEELINRMEEALKL